ncbi:hypothetical protein LTR37_001581 [Vermiconidia calcicola]|uniref:Uncharacterized protein n=1 Tax=Vermiconidia calcicola TaxID=1690605 RepID=A0ACC3NWL2_9PEZI|nr:hypothetical protein LTR37_001581 [Vermiconidia calcicola]
MSAAQKVFDLPELLEHVLGFLPVKDLLLASTVCRSFKNMIDASRPIQRQLYLLGGKGVEVKEFHPIFFAGTDESCDENSVAQNFCFPIEKLFFDCSLRTDRVESWENMHITQPPSTTAIVYLEFNWAHFTQWEWVEGLEEISVARPDGVRISDVMDIFAEFWEMDCTFDYAQASVTVPQAIEMVEDAETQHVASSKMAEDWAILGESGYGRNGRIWANALRKNWIGEWLDPRGGIDQWAVYPAGNKRDWDLARGRYVLQRQGEVSEEKRRLREISKSSPTQGIGSFGSTGQGEEQHLTIFALSTCDESLIGLPPLQGTPRESLDAQSPDEAGESRSRGGYSVFRPRDKVEMD